VTKGAQMLRSGAQTEIIKGLEKADAQ
jgi:hypothetical protein